MSATASAPGGAFTTKDRSIQALRGVACILVVMLHSRGFGSYSLPMEEHPSVHGPLLLLEYLRMPLFTFLSGYVYAIRPITTGTRPWRFLRAKTRRLMLPMLVVGTVFMIAIETIPGWSPENIVRPWWTWHIIPVAQFWFIWAIFWCFLVVAYLDYRGWLSRRSWMLTAIILVLIASSALPKGARSPFALLAAVYLALFFLAGIACRRFDWRGTSPRWHVLTLGAFVVLLGSTIVLTAFGMRPPADELIGNLLGLVACMLLLLLRLRWRPLELIGSHAFPVFLFHFGLIQIWRVILVSLHIDNVIFATISGTLVGILASIALERLVRMSRVTSTLVLGERWAPRKARTASDSRESARPQSERPEGS
ncbi:acyltransferase [Leifsonia sp. TF02-11]|uniref:acyltransferase family protein n=1 Tax=Leifsonia sp. TF02-11 TaxID=2815212 RepID=UPI001AA118C3|nr:acyltransferase [Leifsonia sp. TF02-11]MBO1740841.1 acyltransferase [Leifsonia sp. TF02-11]